MGLEDQVVAFAFGAGVLTFFSPCSIAMLPAYISYYLGRDAGRAPTIADPASARRVSFAVLAAILGGALLLGSALHDALRILGTNHFAFGLYDRLVALAGVALLALAAFLLLRVWRDIGGSALRGVARGAAGGAGFGLVTTAGFVTVFGGVGLLFLGIQQGPLASGLRSALPAISVVAAVLVFALGLLLFLDRDVSWIPTFVAPKARNVVSFYAFGVGYALVATGCLLPVFLAVVNAALLVPAATGAAALLAYGLGAGALMTVASAYLGTTTEASLGLLDRFRPHVKRVSGFVIMEMAMYIVWFDYVGVLRPLEGITVLGEDPLWLLGIPVALAAAYAVVRRATARADPA